MHILLWLIEQLALFQAETFSGPGAFIVVIEAQHVTNFRTLQQIGAQDVVDSVEHNIHTSLTFF